MAKKKCPICGKNYRDYITHIWTHKKKTVAYLQKKRKAAAKKKGNPKKKRSKKGFKAEMMDLLDKYF